MITMRRTAGASGDRPSASGVMISGSRWDLKFLVGPTAASVETPWSSASPMSVIDGKPENICSSGYDPVRAENLDPDVLVMQPANQGVRHDASDRLNRARDRSILVQ